jgi:hypothetical protein
MFKRNKYDVVCSFAVLAVVVISDDHRCGSAVHQDFGAEKYRLPTMQWII